MPPRVPSPSPQPLGSPRQLQCYTLVEYKECEFGHELDPGRILISPFSDCVAWIMLLTFSSH